MSNDNNPPKRTVLPTKFATEADDHANLPKYERKNENNPGAPLDSEPGRMHKPARPGANFDEKVYMFPDSFNALRIELHDHWPNLFKVVGYWMAFDAMTFIELMDDALDTRTTFDTQMVDAICKKYIDLLRNKRGLSSLHADSEKA